MKQIQFESTTEDLLAALYFKIDQKQMTWREVLDRAGLDYDEVGHAIRTGDYDDDWMHRVIYSMSNIMGVPLEELASMKERCARSAYGSFGHRDFVHLLVRRFILMRQPPKKHRKILIEYCAGLVCPQSTSTLREAARNKPPRTVADVSQCYQRLVRQNRLDGRGVQ